ncbi:MAG TPA: hypothetical protein K8W01_16590 [Methylorubrum populi]|uniref:Uncharacterized protein n=1 Tax=Methylorubrum populi TaxID=223967 RepID=A0A921E668_9HYPH|nr:hypothetical protein [Methylorubrum populi]
MPTNDTDALADIAALCTAARARLPVSSCHRLRVLLDMILIDLEREQPKEAVASERQDRT